MLTPEEATAKVAATTAPRVTVEGMKAKIADERYLQDGLTTICIIELQSGFKLVGHSTPASAANFDLSVGQYYAYENAFRQMWQLEGYLLREQLSTQE
jgi:hypothetical protein